MNHRRTNHTDGAVACKKLLAGESSVVFLHVGGDRLVALSGLVAILDAGVLTESPETRQMYLRLRSEGAVNPVDPYWRRSLLVTDEGITESTVASLTLYDRWHRMTRQWDTDPASSLA